MKVDRLHIFGISKNKSNDEVNKGIVNIKSRYVKKGMPKENISVHELSLEDLAEFAKSNRKGKKAQKAFQGAFDEAIANAGKDPAKVGVYAVFHGGTEAPLNFEGLAWIILKLTDHYAGSLQKVVLSACYFAIVHPSMSQVPFNNFCTTLFVKADEQQRKILPMLAAWRNDVYIGNASAKLGHTTTKGTEGGYISINSEIRTKNKVIAVRGSDNYVVKTYEDGAEEWHDGAVESASGVVNHVKS